MPQELRLPQYRTEPPNILALKLIDLRNLSLSPSIVSRGEAWQSMALNVKFPNRSRLDEVMIIKAIQEIDSVYIEYAEMIDQVKSDKKQDRVS